MNYNYALIERLRKMSSQLDILQCEDVLLAADIIQGLEDEDFFVIRALKDYYKLCAKPDKIDNSDDVIEPDETILNAIDRVLQDYMTPDEYFRWTIERVRRY